MATTIFKMMMEMMHVYFQNGVFQAAEHVLGSVLCAPGCFSVYRCSALKDIIPTYASSVERAFEFLIKDMGEDRWLCTLMVSIWPAMITINNI